MRGCNQEIKGRLTVPIIIMGVVALTSTLWNKLPFYYLLPLWFVHKENKNRNVESGGRYCLQFACEIT